MLFCTPVSLSLIHIFISGILGVGLAIALFAILPTLIFTGIQTLFGDTDISAFRSLTEGIIKIALFVGYLWLTSLMKTMKRLYQYHGAEHKTIFCYEHGEELTVENVRKYKRFHPRCGTSFIFLTLAISILVYTLLPINSEMFIEAFGVSKLIGDMLRVCCKIIFLPIVVGISYELIRIAGKYDNVLTKIISAPGLAIPVSYTHLHKDTEQGRKRPQRTYIRYGSRCLHACLLYTSRCV